MRIAYRRTGSLFAVLATAFALLVSVGASPALAWDATQMRNAQQEWFNNVCLEVDNASTSTNAAVTVDWCTQGGHHQLWTREDISNGWMMLRVKHTGQCLDVKYMSAADGTQIVQNTCNVNRLSQHWRFDWASEQYTVLNKYTGKCLDKSGWNVVLWGCHGWEWQQWTRPWNL